MKIPLVKIRQIHGFKLWRFQIEWAKKLFWDWMVERLAERYKSKTKIYYGKDVS